MLITTTGAKTGLARTSPVVHTNDGDDVIIIASKAGAPSHPDWYRNLKANPTVTVELPGDTYQAEAVRPPARSATASMPPGRADAQLRRVREADRPQDPGHPAQANLTH